MQRAHLLLLLIMLPFSTALARADTLGLCVDANAWAPYTYPSRDGTLQVLAKMTAIQLGDSISIVALPWVRCQKSVESGALQGMIATSDTDYALRTFALPRLRDAGATLDTSRAMGSGTILLLRRVGSDVHWDGKHLSGQQGPVLYVFGYSDVRRHLQAIGVASDGGASDNEQNARKILAGRAEVMAIYLGDAASLMARPEFAGKLEPLAPPLGDSEYYLAFNLQYYAAHRDMIEQFWDELRTVRHSPNYRLAIENIR